MENLIDYVLIDIFKCMDEKSLLTCTEVCKRWNNLINESKGTKMTLYINKKTEFLHLNRQYYNVKVTGISTSDEFLKTIQPQVNIRKLEIDNVMMQKINLLTVFENLKLLEELKISDSLFKPAIEENHRTIILSKLKSLTILESTKMNKVYANQEEEFRYGLWPYFKFIKISNLQKLQISSQFRRNAIPENFFSQFLSLEELKLNGKRNLESILEILTDKKRKNQIELRKFSTDTFMSYNEVIKSFFEQQKKTLENLELKRIDLVLLKFILLNMNLKFFKLQISHFPLDSSKFDSIPKNLTNLDISSMSYLLRSNKFKAQQIFPFYSNIRELKLSRRDNDDENQVILNMPELNILTIEQFFSSTEETNFVNFNCRLPNLQMFTLFSNRFNINQELLEKFKKNFPRLKFLNLFESEMNKKFLVENQIQDLNIRLYSEEYLKENKKYERICNSFVEFKDNVNLININFI